MALKLCFRQMRWYFCVTDADSGARNMAVDEALMTRAGRTGEAVFRVYGWSQPTLSLGRNQRARGLYDLPTAAALGVDIVRRPTGGRALLHHREVTYSVTQPVADVTDARVAYDFVNEVLLGALNRLGVAAARATTTASLPPGPRPCFDVPAEREIVVGDRKLVGSAQWRNGGTLLQHGSILVGDDQPLIARLMKAAEMAPPAAATLADALGYEPQREVVAALIRDSLARQTGSCVDTLPDDPRLASDTARYAATYADESWTWRR